MGAIRAASMRGAAMRAAAVMLLLHCLGQAAEEGKGVPADLGSVEGVDLGAAQRDQRGFGGMGGGLATKGSFAMMGGGGWEEDEALSDTRLGESVATKGRKGKKKAGGKKKAAAKKPKKAAPKKGKVAKAKAATKDAKSAANTLAVKGSDPGAPARCKQTHGQASGHLDCKPTQDKCEVAKFTQNKAAC